MSTFSNDDDWNISEGDDCWGEGSSTSIRTLQQQVDLLIGQVTTLISTTNDLGGNLANHINANVVSGEDVHKVNDKYNGIFESLRSIQSAINNLEYSKQNSMTAVPYPSNRGEGYYFTPATITAYLDEIFQSLSNKQDALRVDTEPTAGHGIGYYVTSAGVKTALDTLETELYTEIQSKLTVVSELPSDPHENTIVYLTRSYDGYIKGHVYEYSYNNVWVDISIPYTEYTIPAHKYIKATTISSGMYFTSITGALKVISDYNTHNAIFIPAYAELTNSSPTIVYNGTRLSIGYIHGTYAGRPVTYTVLANTSAFDITIKIPADSIQLGSAEYYDLSTDVYLIREPLPSRPTSAGNYVLKTTVTTGTPNYINYNWEADDSTAAIDAVKKTSPIGLIASWWVDANNNIPEGWFACDGTAIASLPEISSTEKQKLMTALGNSNSLPVADNMIILGYYPFAREA